MAWPLVGRDAAVGQVVEALRRPARGPLVVTGPAGVGKSRLLAEARARAAAAGVRVESAVATPATGAIPFGAFAHLVPVAAAGDAAARIAATLARLRQGARASTAVVVDDADLLDTASAALLHVLAADRSVGVVAAVRTAPDGPPPSLVRDLAAVRLDLGGLPPADVAALLPAALGGTVESGLVQRLVRLSGGNPLLLRELVDAGLAAGSVAVRHGVWRGRGPLLAAGSLPEAVAARLDRLPPQVRMGAELVALAEPVGTALLAAVLPPDRLAELDDARLLVPLPDRRRREVGLVHPLYGEALRATTPALRAAEHRRVLADALAATGARRAHDALRAAVWRLEAGDRSDAGLFLAAAHEAAVGLDHALAHRLAQAAVDAGGGQAAELALLPHLPRLGRLPEALGRAEALAAAGPPEDLRPRLAAVRARLLLLAGEPRRADEVLEKAAATAPTPEARDALTVRQAEQAWAWGALQRCLRLSAGKLADAGFTPALMPRLAAVRIRGLCMAGRTAEARALAERTLEALPAAGAAGNLQRAAVRLAWTQTLGYGGELTRGLAVIEAALADPPADGAGALRGLWAAELGHANLMAGRARTATRWLRESMAVIDAVDGLPVPLQLYGLDGLAHAAALAGDAPAAARHAARLAGLLPPGYTPLRRVGEVWAQAVGGELSRARATARTAAEALAAEGACMDGLLALVAAAEAGGGVLAADADLAATLAGRCESPLARALGSMLVGLGRADAAALDEAGGVLAAGGYGLWAAEALAAASAAHRAAGRAGSATASAERARAAAAACEVAGTALLALAGGTDALTAREREVAGLAARGLSDRDIASRLQLSVRTVHSHLHRAYRKLGVTERGQLAPALGVLPEP